MFGTKLAFLAKQYYDLHFERPKDKIAKIFGHFFTTFLRQYNCKGPFKNKGRHLLCGWAKLEKYLYL
jgi:hypothetical protein